MSPDTSSSGPPVPITGTRLTSGLRGGASGTPIPGAITATRDAGRPRSATRPVARSGRIANT